VPPAIAVLGPIMREREDVVGGLANGAQDSATLGWEGLGELLGEVHRQQRRFPRGGQLKQYSSVSFRRGQALAPACSEFT
jgi:hypothetical protein